MKLSSIATETWLGTVNVDRWREVRATFGSSYNRQVMRGETPSSATASRKAEPRRGRALTTILSYAELVRAVIVWVVLEDGQPGGRGHVLLGLVEGALAWRSHSEGWVVN